jgi:hypothetical protein
LCFPIYYFPASPISVAYRRNRSTGTCESCWSSLKLCPEMRPRDIVRVSHSHSRCSTVSLPLVYLLHKGFISLPILYKWPFRPRCPVSRPITTDSCCLLMVRSLIALPCWGPSMRALECLQALDVFARFPALIWIHKLNIIVALWSNKLLPLWYSIWPPHFRLSDYWPWGRGPDSRHFHNVD